MPSKCTLETKSYAILSGSSYYSSINSGINSIASDCCEASCPSEVLWLTKVSSVQLSALCSMASKSLSRSPAKLKSICLLVIVVPPEFYEGSGYDSFWEDGNNGVKRLSAEKSRDGGVLLSLHEESLSCLSSVFIDY